jgi:hypothetical protein
LGVAATVSSDGRVVGLVTTVKGTALAGLVDGTDRSTPRGRAEAAGREAVEIVPTVRSEPAAGRVAVGESATAPTGITVTRPPLMIVLFATGPNDSGGVV